MNSIFPSEWYQRWFPLTTAIGFLEASFSDVVTADQAWRTSIGRYSFQPLRGPLHHQLTALLPLTAPLLHYLWVPTTNAWTAYFDNFCNGGDPYGPISVLSENLGCRGVIITYVPQLQHTYGAARFDLYSPQDHPTPHNLVRCVAAINDGGRWDWTAYGAPQVFEQLTLYTARHIQNRLSWPLLVQYAQALGIDLYTESFYASEGIMITNREIHHIAKTEQIEQYQNRIFQ